MNKGVPTVQQKFVYFFGIHKYLCKNFKNSCTCAIFSSRICVNPKNLPSTIDLGYLPFSPHFASKTHFLERMSLKNLYICEKSSTFAAGFFLYKVKTQSLNNTNVADIEIITLSQAVETDKSQNQDLSVITDESRSQLLAVTTTECHVATAQHQPSIRDRCVYSKSGDRCPSRCPSRCRR